MFTQGGGHHSSYFHISGNKIDDRDDINKNNARGVTLDSYGHLVDNILVPTKFYTEDYTFDINAYTVLNDLESADDAFNSVMAKSGCIVRDSIERRIIKECKEGTSTFGGSWKTDGNYGIIDDPIDAEMSINADGTTYCRVALPSENRPDGWDSDGDGMPDAWEDANGFDKNNAADGNYVNAEGYTALEKYLASLMGEEITGPFVGPDRFFRIVAKDGSGDFTTVQSAVDDCSNVADKTVRQFIFIKNGTYEEQVTIPQNAVITMIGESRDGVNITRARSHSEGDIGEEETTTMYINGSDFYGENFTVANTAGPDGGQAEALTNNGDRLTLKNVAIKGNQDALRFNDSSRSYLYKCYVEGSVDYIFEIGRAHV